MINPRTISGRFRNLLLFTTIALQVFGCSVSKERPTLERSDYLFHTVAYSGETISLLSLWYTKRMENWPVIAQANPQVDINRIKIGETIRIPRRLVRRTETLRKSAIPSNAPLVKKAVLERASPQDSFIIETAESTPRAVKPLTVPLQTEHSIERQQLLSELLSE